MRKTATITINNKIITINELTMKQLLSMKDGYSGDIMQAVQTMLPMLTDATPEFLLELAPSELLDLYEKVKEVNHAFFTMLPLDKILAGYHDTMIESIQNSLQNLSANSLPADME